MIWAVAGIVYAAVYAALVWALGGHPYARLVAGNVALLLPPLAPLLVIARRRRVWFGRQSVFWTALGLWALLWLIGQIGWAIDELLRGQLLPWFRWHVVLQLSGSMLPLLALVAWPHRGPREETATTAAIDVAVLGFLTGFLYWSLIIAPGREASEAAVALRLLAVVGPIVRLATLAGLLWAAALAGTSAWASVYRRLAAGMGLAFVVLIGLSLAAVRDGYQTGSFGDVGLMLPFWFAAWAAAGCPASVRQIRSVTSPLQPESPVLLFAAILIVAIVGYGLPHVMPVDARVDPLRDGATAFTLLCSIGLVMVRLRVEQRSLERANEHVRRLATACEQSAELMLITRDGRIEFANEAFCRAVGYSREELEAFPTDRLVAPESQAAIPALREQLQRRQPVRAMTAMVRKDGTMFQAAWSAAPVLDAAGRVTGIVAAMRDLTDELRLREQLVRSERISAIAELVSGVAHELNNPLQSILGSLEILLTEPHEPGVRDDLERARREATRAARIIRHLLAFSRRSPDARLLVDLNEIVQETVGLRAYELQVAAIELREDYATGLPLVLANRDEIQQVVANLVLNAEQAMAGRGRGVLTVRTRLAPGQTVTLDVLDDGPGVAPDMAARIFEPFVTTKSDGSGPGLGLSQSFGIAHAHGGSLELVPTESGACFRLTLPGAGFPGPAPLT